MLSLVSANSQRYSRRWSPHVYATGIAFVTGIYVVNGGMFGVVLTDVLQYMLTSL